MHVTPGSGQPAPGSGGAADGAVPARPEALLDALALLVTRVAAVAQAEPEVGRACQVVGRWMVELGAAPAAAATPSAPPEAPAPLVERVLQIGGVSLPIAVRPAREGVAAEPGPRVEPERAPARPARPEHPPLATVAARARLKADCCRWAVERRKRLRDGADFEQLIKPTDALLGGRARALPDCYAWPLDPYLSLPDDRALDDAAGCYEALADAVELAERVRRDDELFGALGERTYKLLAECCSGLRAILTTCNVARDADQDAAFDWLRTRVFDDRIYVARHMRLDDPADPAAWPERRDRAALAMETVEAFLSRAKEVRNLTGKLSYVAKRWEDLADEEAPAQAGSFAAAVERLVELGLSPADPRIRDPLLVLAADLPEGFAPGGAIALALRLAEEHAARREAESRADVQRARPTAEVQEVRELLAGKVAVLIGGTCRPMSRDALREGLGLSELRWITTREHEPVRNFAAQCVREDVALVILAIRWSSHAFDDVKAACLAAGKPYVRLPRGYGLNQVAKEVVAQVSEALARTPHPPSA